MLSPGPPTSHIVLVFLECPCVFDLCSCPQNLPSHFRTLILILPPSGTLFPRTAPHLLHHKEIGGPQLHLSKSPPLDIKICFMSPSSAPSHKIKILTPKSISTNKPILFHKERWPSCRWPFPSES